MIVALFSSWFPGEMFADANGPAARLVLQPRVLVIAHRGASADYPENTIPSFEAAAKARADLIELDYYHSKDQVPIVFHDQELDRTTDACQQLSREKVAVDTLNWPQLQQLDAGAWFRPEFAGTRIPTLREALSTIRGESIALIERKGGDAATCVQLLRELDAVEHVVVQSFDWDYIRSCRQQEPRLTVAVLGDKELSLDRINQATDLGAKVIGWNGEDLDAAAIRTAHQHGMRVWAYTVNKEPRVRQLIRDGIDGLITDRPAFVRSIVQRVTTDSPEEER